ncbi:hypothetical protein LL668_06870 [Providencia rettgeri]|uniref:hypothetical protein n=1 Tax=Providencia rettgeri TaxID=587 RepID=UPI001E404E5E|nr:hypothetical protein [Providencia rettgeri]UEK60852.1 hypothetical protein LL668_06870 [Providencia rettgeri]
MSSYIAKLDDSLTPHSNAIKRAFSKAIELANKKSSDILLIVPMIQALSHSALSDAFGSDIAKKIQKGDLEIGEITLSRTIVKKLSTYQSQSVFIVLWPSLIDAEHISANHGTKADIVVCEWGADELERWRKEYKAKII